MTAPETDGSPDSTNNAIEELWQRIRDLGGGGSGGIDKDAIAQALVTPGDPLRTAIETVGKTSYIPLITPRVDMDKAILVGSSTMAGMATRFATEFAARGVATSHAKTAVGAWVTSTMGAAVGTRPLVAEEFTIPATGPVTIKPTNMSESNTGTINLPGSFLGVDGVLTSWSGSDVFNFTRSAPGSAIAVPAGTSFIPSEPADYLNGLAVLNIGKNTLTVSRPGWDAQRVIDMTETMIQRFGGTEGRVFVVGQFNNGGTPEVSTTRTKIKRYNDHFRDRLGDRFFDLGAYVTGTQVWTDTGLTPTTEDQAEQALGNIPPSIRNDPGHLNTAGYTAAVNAIIAKIDALGWIAPRPPVTWQTVALDGFSTSDGTMFGSYTETGKLQYVFLPGSTVSTRVADKKIQSTTGTTRIGLDVKNDDQWVEAAISGIDADPNKHSVRLLVRVQRHDTYYFAAPRKDATNHGLSIWRYEAGVLASVKSTTAVTPKDGDRLALSIEGSTLRLWLNGDQVLEASDSNLKNGIVGIELGPSASISFDDLVVKIPSSATTPPEGSGIVTSDSFAGADATSLTRSANAALGGLARAWVPDAADRWGIKDNALVRGGGAGGTGVLNFGDTAIQDGEITAKVAAMPEAGNSLYFDARRNPNNAGYRLWLLPTGSIRLQRRDSASVSTGLGTGSTCAVGDVIGIRVKGDKISMIKNGAVVETVTDGEVPTGGRWGLAYSVTGAAGSGIGAYKDYVLTEVL